MEVYDTSSDDLLETFKKSVSPDSQEFLELKEKLELLETRWYRKESEICELKDRELESLESQLKAAHHREQFINEIGQQLTASLDLETIIAVFHKAVSSHIPVDRIILAFYQPLDNALVYRVFEEDSRISEIPDTIHLSSIHRLVVKSVQEGKLRVYNDLPANEEEFFARKGGSAILAPLRIEGSVRGVILLHTDQGESYGREHRGLLLSLSPFIAIAVSNARSHEEVEILNQELEEEKKELVAAHARITRMANYDSLTDLPNLRLLNEFLPRYMEQAKRQGWTLAVFFVDLDDFKPVNDTYGHETGDRILIEASGRIRKSLRRSDIVARVGGDEFIALVQGISGEEGVKSTAEKILAAVLEPFLIEDCECILGASIGISLYPGDGLTPEELKNNADSAMYKVKGSGKAGYLFFRDLSDTVQ